MARCRSYLRGLDICVTVLLLVSGVVMISVGFATIDGDVPVAKLEPLSSNAGLLVLQVFGLITVVLSVLGICAATLDHKVLLMVFSALIFVEFVALMVVASPLVQVQTQMDSTVDELFLNVTPLHRADEDLKQELNKLESEKSCCGLRSYEDWDIYFPDSCFCTPPISPSPSSLQPSSQASNSSSQGPCVLAGNDHSPPTPHVTHKWVHSKPCGPILKNYLSFPIKLRIGIISAFATIAITAIVLSVVLGLEEYWKKPPVEMTVDDFNRVKYQPKPTLT